MPKKSVYYQVDRTIFFGKLQRWWNMAFYNAWRTCPGFCCRNHIEEWFDAGLGLSHILDPLNLHQYIYVYPYVLNQTAITWRKPHFETPLGIGHPAMTLGQRSFRKLKSWDRTWSKNNPGETFNPSKSNYRRKVLNIMKHVGLPRNDDILVYPPNSGFNGAMMINHDKPFFELLGTSVFKINPIFAKPW